MLDSRLPPAFARVTGNDGSFIVQLNFMANQVDAWVLLPDHLHCVRTLPDGDAGFSTRWMIIKRAVSLACREDYRRADWMNASKLKHREPTIWQRRFWEHQTCPELMSKGSRWKVRCWNMIDAVLGTKTCPPYDTS